MLLEMLQKGKHRFWALIESSGGCYEVGELNDIWKSPPGFVISQIQSHQILAFKRADGTLCIPRFQFDPTTRHPFPGLKDVLVATESWPVEETARFLLHRFDPEHHDKRPIDYLREGQLAAVLDLAHTHLTQRP